MNIYKFISQKIKSALLNVPEIQEFMDDKVSAAIIVEVPKNRDFGDFSTNVAMVLARPMKMAPRGIAEKVAPVLEGLDFVRSVSVAGPGFINITLTNEFILTSAQEKINFENVDSKTVDLDYGGYNIGKSLHIGHLRTTVVGDTFNRVAQFIGHKTRSYNHMGDWGRPMGLIIAWVLEYGMPKTADDINDMYPKSTQRAKEDEEWLARAKEITVELQNGNPEYRAIYDSFAPISLQQIDIILSRLNVLPFDENKGERLVAEFVPAAEKTLIKSGVLTHSEGAEVIMVKQDDDTAPMPPVLWRSSAGAQTYAAADLTAVYYRMTHDLPNSIIYFTDSRQNLHFTQIFRAAKLAGFVNPDTELKHIGFGTITGADGKPFKTRDGNVPSLIEMLDMVKASVQERVAAANKELSDDAIEKIALAALRYNDLMHNVRSDYVFDTESVTSFEGRTGPYILYTAVRMNKILQKAGNFAASDITELNSSEYDVLFEVLDFERIVLDVFDNQDPSILANYTYGLCQKMNSFYHNCPILQDGVSEDLKNHRLQILSTVIKVLMAAIDLMGLTVPAEM